MDWLLKNTFVLKHVPFTRSLKHFSMSKRFLSNIHIPTNTSEATLGSVAKGCFGMQTESVKDKTTSLLISRWSAQPPEPQPPPCQVDFQLWLYETKTNVNGHMLACCLFFNSKQALLAAILPLLTWFVYLHVHSLPQNEIQVDGLLFQ